MTIFETIER